MKAALLFLHPAVRRLDRRMENLCDQPAFTGYTVNGGFAEYALARTDFTFPLPGFDSVLREGLRPLKSVAKQ